MSSEPKKNTCVIILKCRKVYYFTEENVHRKIVISLEIEGIQLLEKKIRLSDRDFAMKIFMTETSFHKRFFPNIFVGIGICHYRSSTILPHHFICSLQN